MATAADRPAAASTTSTSTTRPTSRPCRVRCAAAPRVSWTARCTPIWGVPFAKPPVGKLRFRKPEPLEPWRGVLNATRMPNSCIQERYDYFPGFEGEEMWNPNTNVSEDCLYMNIWVPRRIRLRHKNGANPEEERRGVPILVWVYGGGYMTGTATLDVYDADLMAARCDCIIASMQYRVGAFGFLYLSRSTSTRATTTTHRATWASGTRPWPSSGSRTTPECWGLIKRGILQSGTLNAPWSYMTGERANEVGRVLVEDCGCNATMLEDNPAKVMACMRNIEPKTISVQQWNSYGGILGFPSAPTIDGIFLPRDPIEMAREAEFDKTEVIIGNNENEAREQTIVEEYELRGQTKKFVRARILRYYVISRGNNAFARASRVRHVPREKQLERTRNSLLWTLASNETCVRCPLKDERQYTSCTSKQRERERGRELEAQAELEEFVELTHNHLRTQLREQQKLNVHRSHAALRGISSHLWHAFRWHKSHIVAPRRSHHTRIRSCANLTLRYQKVRLMHRKRGHKSFQILRGQI
ncbi:unnamed protein product, partial [Trichogramma brassicae]